MFPRWMKRGLKGVAATGIRPLLAGLCPSQPPLTADEWVTCQYSFSQFGEDRFILNLLGPEAREPGQVYVDIGAHDPVRLSNTLLMHKLGWRGVNVDASEEAIRRFQLARPTDRNVWAAVSDSRREMVYYRYPSVATNRIGRTDEADRRSVIGEDPVSVAPMTTRPLNELLAEFVRPQERIGFLNIDCEGEDLALLRHLDWDRWRPRVVAVEAHGASTTEQTVNVVTGQGYELVGKLLVTLIFRQAKPEGAANPPGGNEGSTARWLDVRPRDDTGAS